MKKIVGVFLFSLLLLVSVTKGQGSGLLFQKGRINASLYSNIWTLQNNSNVDGYGYGVYLDYLPLKTGNNVWSAGLFASASQSGYYQNLSKYTSWLREVRVGLTTGYYLENLSMRRSLFIGFSSGLKYVWDRGESNLRGRYNGNQRDLLIVSNLNLNIFKKIGDMVQHTWFTRSQLLVTLENPLYTYKKSEWNSKTVTSQIWDKTYLEFLFKENIFNRSINSIWKEVFVSPKLLVLYSHSKGNQEDCYGTGLDLTLHKQYKDDFLSVYCLYKMNKQNNTIIIGSNISL